MTDWELFLACLLVASLGMIVGLLVGRALA